MVTEMCPVQSWPGQRQKSVLMPTIQTTDSRSMRAHFHNFPESALHVSYPPLKTKSGASLSKPCRRSQPNHFKNGKGYSPNLSKARYVHKIAKFPSISNGNHSTSSSPFPQKSRPHTKGSFPSIDSPLPRARSLPSQMSMSNDYLSRQNTRCFTREPTKQSLRASKLQAADRTRHSLQREPTLLAPSKHGFHQRSKSPTYKALIDVREYLEANLAKKIKEFIQSREGIRARNNSVMTDITSSVDVKRMTPEDTSSAVLNEYFEADVQGIDGTSVSDIESIQGEFTESRESVGVSRDSTSTFVPQQTPPTSFNFNLGYLREHLNDSRLLSLDIDEIEKRYRLKHKSASLKAKKPRRVIAPPTSDPLFLPLPFKKPKRKEHKQYDDQTIEEENESRDSLEESDDELTETISARVDVFKYKSANEDAKISPVRNLSPKLPKSFTIDDIDKKMAETSETLKFTFKKISEAEQKGVVAKPKVPDPEPEVEEKPPEMTEKEKFQKMKERMAQRKQHRASRKESYLQYSMQLEHITKMNKTFEADEDSEGGNLLASMTFKKLDNIMKFKTRKKGRLGIEVPLSDSDDEEEGEEEDDDDEDDDGTLAQTEDGELSD
ncbi:uncharacterized protein LOC144452821 [Glandiceps talaboti]